MIAVPAQLCLLLLSLFPCRSLSTLMCRRFRRVRSRLHKSDWYDDARQSRDDLSRVFTPAEHLRFLSRCLRRCPPPDPYGQVVTRGAVDSSATILPKHASMRS